MDQENEKAEERPYLVDDTFLLTPRTPEEQALIDRIVKETIATIDLSKL